MTLGRAPDQGDIFNSGSAFCDGKLSPTSIYRYLHDNCHRLFPDDAFADLFKDIGRRSVPPRIVAVVMTLQKLEGLSDREAVDRLSFDLRWKYAAGGLDVDYPGFVHTVLVDMRARLRESERPDRLFAIVLEVAKAAGLVGRKRVLDSTPLYDAVATQDTVTMIRSAIRGLLRESPAAMAEHLRGLLQRDDDYSTAGKPSCDWDDAEAREAVVDELTRDANALVQAMEGKAVSEDLKKAATLLATVVGQDIEETEDGKFRIARRVAKDRVISTVDPEARHGHKTAARGFDGYKGHISLDPDSEIITATKVTAGNVGDGAVAEDLLDEALSEDGLPQTAPDAEKSGEPDEPSAPRAEAEKAMAAYGDAAYGTADNIKALKAAGIESKFKVQGPASRNGKFSKDDFTIDLDNKTVTCPNDVCVDIRPSSDGGDVARFGKSCSACPLRSRCTESKAGRTITIHPEERLLSAERERQKDPGWLEDYRATRPKVERKIGHLMFRHHGGRRARVRGKLRVGHDFAMLAAVANLKRLAVLAVPVCPAPA
jgi:IS5 family transposase